MKSRFFFFILFLLVTVSWVAAPVKMSDRQGFKDPALFTRMPNFYLHQNDSFVEKPFDAFEFDVLKDGKSIKEHVEGHYWFYRYRFDETAGPIPSALQIVRNYQAAATRIGGKVVFDNPKVTWTTLVVSRDGRETWVEVTVLYDGKEYNLKIVEKQAMQQDVIANAAALQDALTQNGHVEVPGIFFDTAKSDIKPESEPALLEMAKLLANNTSLRVWVVGHTDAVGTAESNVTLSNARAASVVRYLTQKLGVDARRLTPYGVGPFSPVASNGSEEGRARNRRVELVAQM